MFPRSEKMPVLFYKSNDWDKLDNELTVADQLQREQKSTGSTRL